MSPLGTGPGKVDAPLLPKSTLTLAYGGGYGHPWVIGIDQVREKKWLGFYKLFLSTSPTNFSSIPQQSPFSDFLLNRPPLAESPVTGPPVAESGSPVAGGSALLAPKVWATKLITVIL